MEVNYIFLAERDVEERNSFIEKGRKMKKEDK